MPKQTAVKWALGGDEPEDLQDFLSNEDIEKKNGGLPAKGTYTFAVRQIRNKPISGGDNKGKPRLSIMLTVAEDKKSPKAKWNGYMLWDGVNVTEQGAPFVKRFLRALGLTWDDFMKRTKQDDQDPPHITQIGKVKFEQGKDPLVRASINIKGADDYNDGDHAEVGRYLPADDEPIESAEDEEPEDDDDVAVVGDEEDEEDEDVAALREELEGLSKKKVLKRAIKNNDSGDYDEDDLEAMDKDDLIDIVIEQELGEDEEDEEEPDEDAIEELRTELMGLKVAALKKRALRNDEDADLGDGRKATIVQVILEQELNAPPF